MKQVRIQPESNTVHLIDIVCDCGANGLRDNDTWECSFKHSVTLGGRDIQLICECGTKYLVRPQSSHFHVSQEDVQTTTKDYPPISPGTSVKTTEPNLGMRGEWTDEGWAKRKWDMQGEIITHHDSHGLCYDVRHEDGTVGCYDPSEFEVVEQGINLDELQEETEKLLALLKDRQPGLFTWNELFKKKMEKTHSLLSQIVN